MGRVEDDQPLDALGIGRGKDPTDIATPVIGDQDTALLPEMIEQTMEVSEKARHCIGFDIIWRVRWRIAAQVWRHDQVIAAEFSQLGLVQRPAVGMTMQKHHEWP